MPHIRTVVDESECSECAFFRTSLCNILGRGSAAELAALRSRQICVRPKGLLIAEQQTPHEIYRVLSGWGARIRMHPGGGRQILSLDLPGDFLAPELLSERPVRFTKVALTKMTLCAFPQEVALRSRGSNDELARFFSDAWEDRVQMLENQVVMIGRMHAAARVASLLIQLYQRLFARGLVHDDSFEFPLRHEDLGDMLGLTPAHVSRTLSVLRGEKLIEITDGRVRLLDLAGLQRAAN